MTGALLAALSAALVCTVLLWIIHETMMNPVKPGKNTVQYILIEVSGYEPKLENHLRKLLWLRDNKTLRCRIIINGIGLDEETRFIAKTFEEENDCISFCENGEIPTWILKMN